MEITTDHVEEYLGKLSKMDLVMIGAALERLEREGHKARMPFSRSLRHGLFELRVSQQRILYFFSGGKAILTNGFKKQTGQTPQHEFSKALRVKKLYS